MAGELALDGRAEVARLAAVTGWSASTVRRRIAGLRAAGVLHFEVDESPSRFGFPRATHRSLPSASPGTPSPCTTSWPTSWAHCRGSDGSRPPSTRSPSTGQSPRHLEAGRPPDAHRSTAASRD
ncbi:AsnC family transcriptional regulator [Streptomyces cucumeris]|uniref:AsnC family transcriptional regulator n=1 Tax=Streptomyces cucumeris TaxID=2962890 RepID=UPI003D756D3F